MRFILPLLFFSPQLFAQQDIRVQTPFNSFIKQPNISWAIKANDTLLCTKPDLKTLLIAKMKAKKILTSAYISDDSKEEINIKYSSVAANIELLEGTETYLPVFDSLGNINHNEQKITKNKLTDNAPGLLYTHQKIYVQNATLLSYVSYVAPLKKIITSQGLNLGTAEIFATAFNKKFNYVASPKDKIIFLTKTEKVFFVDSVKKEDTYKETFGKNLVETLWPFVLNGTIKAYSATTDKVLTIKDINASLLGEESIEVPVFDSLGNPKSKKISSNDFPISPTRFTKVVINQTWYYNDTRNIVFNKVPNIILYAPAKNELELQPVLRLNFNN